MLRMWILLMCVQCQILVNVCVCGCVNVNVDEPNKGVSNRQAREESEDCRQLSFIASSSGGAAQLIGPGSTHRDTQQTAEPTEVNKEVKPCKGP